MKAGEAMDLGTRVAALDGGFAEVTAENVQPSPVVWPVCDTCGTVYVLRLAYSLSAGRTWAWMRDCAKPRSTCKAATVSMHDAEGEVPAGGR